MDAPALIARLQGVERRRACSDAERRAAALLRGELRRIGRREARTRTVWVRPSSTTVTVLVAALAVAGSLVAVSSPAVGVGLALAALALHLGDATGLAPVLRRLTPARATQLVLARQEREATVRVLLLAQTDVPRAGLLDRGAGARLAGRAQRAARGHLPGPAGWMALGTAGIVAAAAARGAGADGRLLGVLQLVPTLLVLAALAVVLDRATAKLLDHGTSQAGAAAVVLALTEHLQRRPLRHLAVDVAFHGAAEPGQLALRELVRAERRAGRDPAQLAVLDVAACATGAPAWATHDGPLLARAAHPQLVRCAAATAQAERHLGAGLVRDRRASAAWAVRRAGWPSIRLQSAAPPAEDPDRADPAAVQALLELALGLLVRLDEELAQQHPSTGS